MFEIAFVLSFSNRLFKVQTNIFLKTGLEHLCVVFFRGDLALIGLAVMGQNLILNMNDHGFTVSRFASRIIVCLKFLVPLEIYTFVFIFVLLTTSCNVTLIIMSVCLFFKVYIFLIFV